MKVLKIEHLGIACRSTEGVARFYSEVLGLPVMSRESIPDMKLQVVKIQVGESVLELLEPQEGEAVISKFLGSRGEGIHHVCLEVEDIREAIRELKAKGYRPLWDEPHVGAGGKWVTFLRPKDTFGVLLELNQ
ncbi:MAG TPA: methylmalonyl-CoA epimerase, partial [Planctomycetota bacterium]|nr:methylmalonyl-CoA epimerase [Planctomycetota bacterium]